MTMKHNKKGDYQIQKTRQNNYKNSKIHKKKKPKTSYIFKPTQFKMSKKDTKMNPQHAVGTS